MFIKCLQTYQANRNGVDSDFLQKLSLWCKEIKKQ